MFQIVSFAVIILFQWRSWLWKPVSAVLAVQVQLNRFSFFVGNQSGTSVTATTLTGISRKRSTKTGCKGGSIRKQVEVKRLISSGSFCCSPVSSRSLRLFCWRTKEIQNGQMYRKHFENTHHQQIIYDAHQVLNTAPGRNFGWKLIHLFVIRFFIEQKKMKNRLLKQAIFLNYFWTIFKDSFFQHYKSLKHFMER